MALEGRALLSTITVGNTYGSGPGSLLAAVLQADNDGGGDTIVFSSLFNSPQTIILTNEELRLTGKATTTIEGPGSNLLTISGGGAGRVFDVEAGSVALSGVTITGGNAPSGGGVYSHDSTLTLSNVTISGNSLANSPSGGSGGGGLACRGDASTNTNTTTLTNCTISGNSGRSGGGVYNNSYSTLTMADCTLSNNGGATSGGGLLNLGTATLFGCTISGNSANVTGATPGQGGGLDNDGTMVATNCTVSGNYADVSGGGVLNGGGSNTMTLTNCTVSGNSSGGGPSGVVNNATLTMTNTIVSGNKYGDVAGGYGGGNNLVGGNALVAPLRNYGGPTQTMPLLPGSPAIGGGISGTGVPVIDQRGQPRAGSVDIGAFQSQGFILTLAASSAFQSAPINTEFASPLAVTVTAMNSVEPVNGGVVSFAVTPVGSASATLSAATATITRGAASVTSTAGATIGQYLVTATAAGARPVGFVLTNTQAASLGQPTPHPVVEKFDDLASLRAAIAYANSHPGPDTIIFDPGSFGTERRTIVLTGGPLVLTDPATTTIIGPGASLLTLSGGGKSRVFDIEGGSLTLEGMTITDGRADRGGGVLNDGGTLALDNVVLRGNRARIGGALYNNGSATLTDVVLRGNTARVDPRIFSTPKATLAWRKLPSPKLPVQILYDDFNASGGVPQNWTLILGASKDVQEEPQNLTITDPTGNFAGIASTLANSVVIPQQVATTVQVNIRSVSANGNAVFGLFDVGGAGYLAAGIDANGVVVIILDSPEIAQTVKPIGVVANYTGGQILMNFSISSSGIEVTAPGFGSKWISFANLDHFSLIDAFPDGAVPALVGARQPGATGSGSATFEYINFFTPTVPPATITGGRADRGGHYY
jgi:hypothetical protein